MPGQKVKYYSQLSSRQKRRRINDVSIQILDHEQYEVAAECVQGNVCETAPVSVSIDTTPDFAQEDDANHVTGENNSIISSEALSDVSDDERYSTISNLLLSNDDDKVDQVGNKLADSLSREACGTIIAKALSTWMNEEKSVQFKPVNRLLSILRENFPSLPKCTKSLFQHNNAYSIAPMHFGEYAHFDWITPFKEYACNCYNSGAAIDLVANIDGIPLFNHTSKYTAYPILVKDLNNLYPNFLCVWEFTVPMECQSQMCFFKNF